MPSPDRDRPDRDRSADATGGNSPGASAGEEGAGGHASESGPKGDSTQQEREERPGSAALAWRGAKRFAYGLGGLVAAVLVLLGVGLLLLQTEWGSRAAKDLILAKVNPLGEAQLQIDDLDGNWITHLEAKGVRLVRPLTPSDEVPAAPAPAPRTAPDSVRMVQIDSLNTDYRLLELLSNRVHLSGGQVYDPDVRMAQQIDGSWDLLQPFVSDTTAQDTTESAWTVRLDSVRLRGGRLDARFHTRNRTDSTLRVRGLEFFAADMDLGGGRAPRIDVRALAARFTPPGQTLERRLTADGQLNERTLTLRNFDLRSPYSDVSGQGTLLLPDAEGGPVQNIDFRLNADPLSFRDLAGFVPNIDPSRSVRFDLGVAGTSERLRPTLDATFSDGGTATLSGTVATGFGNAPLGADLDGQVRGLDPGFLVGGAPVGEVNGDMAVDLSGTSAETLEGTARAAVFDTRVGEYLFDRTTLDARFPGDGTVVLDAQGGLRGASFAAEGTVRPFGQPPAYDLDGRFQNLDLARFSEGSGQRSDLDGRLSVEGYGTSVADANVTAQLRLGGSRANRFAIDEGQFTARLIDGGLRLQARVRSPEGTADVDGRVALTADPVRYQIREGRVQNLDVAALAGDTTRSSITGTFRLGGSGTTPQGDLRLDVAGLQLTDSYYGPYVINATNLDAAVAGGRVALDGQADLEGGSFALSNAVVYPFAATPSFSVGSASFQDVNIGRLGQYRGGNVEQSSSLNGSVTLDGQGLDPQTMSLAGTARLDSSRLNRQIIQSATVEITLSGGRLAYDGTLEVPEGQTRLAGTGRPFAEDPTFAVTSGTFSGIDVGALAGVEGLDTNLQGEIQSLEGQGFSLEELRGNARIDLTGSRINDATVARGTLDLDASEGVTDLAADLRFEGGGRADVQARLDQTGGRLSYRAEGTLDSLSVGQLLGDGTRAGPLSLSLDVRGQGTDPRTATSQGRIRLTGGRAAGIRAQRLLLDYNLNEGLLMVDTLAVRSNVADATGSGPLALYDPGQRYASNFRFTASVDTLAPVRPLLGDSLAALAVAGNRFQGRLAGQPGGPLRLQSDVNVAGLVYGDTRVSSFDGAVRATAATARGSTGAGGLLPAARALAARGVEALRDAQVRGEAGYLSSGQASVRRADVSAIYGGKDIDLRLRAKVDPERDVQLAGVVDPRPEAQRVRLDTLNVRSGSDRWKLLQDATISYGEEYRVSGLLLFTEGGQQIAADGVVDFDGRQSLVVTIEAFRIGAVADLFGYEGLEGVLGGTLTLSGPAQRPELEGTLDADIVSEGERTGDVRVALDYANQRLGVDATLENQDQSTLTAQGYLPLDLRLANPDDLADVSIPDSAAVGPAPPADTMAIGEEGSPVEITGVDAATLGPEEVAFAVRADAFALAWARPFLDREQVEDIGGRLTADVDVGGTLGAPELRGTATLAGGTFDLANIGTAYQNVRAQLRFTDDRVQVERAVVEAGDGRLTIDGTVALQELTLGQLDLTARASNFRAVETDGYRATASGNLRLQGTTQAPVLRGDLTVRDADLYLDALRGGESNYAEATLGEQDLRALRENFGVRVTEADTTRSQVYQALAMDLDMEIERDTWLRSTANPELDVQLEGDIDLRKDAQEDLQLFGSIEVVPERSRVVQFGKRFEIASGVITFNGNPANPSIDLEAEYNVRARQSRGNEVTITLAVRGRPGDLNFELGSSTPMSTTDIFSYIATGQPAGARTGAGGRGATSLATGAALGQISNLVEGFASAQGVGLDVIEIRTNPQRGTVLTAGEYIYSGVLPNPFFVAVGQPLGAAAGDAGDAGIQTEVTIQYEVTEGLLVRLLRRESIRLNLRYEYAY